MRIKTDDILALGLVLISITMFFVSLSIEDYLLKLLGIAGSISVFIAEIVYLFQKWKYKFKIR